MLSLPNNNLPSIGGNVMATYKVPRGTRVSLVDSQGRVYDYITNYDRIFQFSEIDHLKTTWQTFYFKEDRFTWIVPESHVKVSCEAPEEGWGAAAVYHQEKRA